MLAAMSASALALLAGCDESGQFNLADKLNLRQNAGQTASAASGTATKTVEQDVEAPDVFSVTEAGLWDGRPSLGGVWVAHPDVKEPERVMIRNTANGNFVVGALFRKERDIPGPRLQISSDAATALGMLAGAPEELSVVALRREEVAVDVPAPAPEDTGVIASPEDVSETPLDPIAAAGAAIDAAPEAAQTAAAAPAPVPTPAPAPKPTSSLAKPYLQVGIFSVEANANRTAKQMRSAGMLPTIRKGETGGKPFWRVIVGPAQTSAERNALQAKIRTEGFTDAYPVTN
ncbi:SPOR domain-containing protein [Aliishimia ponticola]|nr:SPOR domain-containing protein [Aliishimia ponticola]